MWTTILGSLAMGMVFIIIFWVLAEAYAHDTQRTAFMKSIEPGMSVMLNGDAFQVISVDRKTDTVMLFNIYYEPFKVDIHRLYPVVPYKTVYRFFKDIIKKKI